MRTPKDLIKQLVEIALLDDDRSKRNRAIDRLERRFPEEDISGYSSEKDLFLRVGGRGETEKYRCFFMTEEGTCESIKFRTSSKNYSELRYIGKINKNYKGYSGRVYPFSNLDNLEKRNNNIYY